MIWNEERLVLKKEAHGSCLSSLIKVAREMVGKSAVNKKIIGFRIWMLMMTEMQFNKLTLLSQEQVDVVTGSDLNWEALHRSRVLHRESRFHL